MDFLSNLLLGFGVALTPMNLIYCFLGVLLGTLIGVLPGIGPIATIAMLLPVTYKLPAVSALIVLAGIYYGAQYGGSTTAILVNIPGESSSVVTCLDGYALARQGKAGTALAIAAIGSFIAGCFGTLVIAMFGPPLADLALRFGPAEYFSLMVLGLVAAVVLAHGSLLKAIAMTILGLFLGLVGTDVTSGTLRYTFGITALSDGIDFVVVAMGMFGFSEIIAALEKSIRRELVTTSLSRIWPSWRDLAASWKAIVRGTCIGSFLGVLPGGGATVASFAAYMVEKRIADDPSRFGKGALEGVAGPESANNAAAQTSFIPLLTLGIPSNAVMALMLGAMTIHGITPGPEVIANQPELFWGIIVSMWIGNALLVLLNLPMIGIWVRLLKIPYGYLYPSILLFCCIGVYSVNNNMVDILATVFFGFLGYLFQKLDCEAAPLLLGLILGPMMEEYLRRALLFSGGNPAVFITQPISLSMLVTAAVLLVIVIAPAVRKTRENAFQE
jgi:putative tricarboxylic transport membrane protein